LGDFIQQSSWIKSLSRFFVCLIIKQRAKSISKKEDKRMSKKHVWLEHFNQGHDLMMQAESLVKTRIKGHRKGLPDSPSYLHSFRVKDMVIKQHHNDNADYDLFIAALLHDIVEDGSTTFEELKNLGFTDRTVELVRLCSHSMEIEDSTERWVEMINRLAQAKDDDAWRIKIADLADNLTESKGLSPENRKFMVEVKAPLLLKLTDRILYSAHSALKSAMNNQRRDMQKEIKDVEERL
jgi:(p)ppGpp synthase/HD superfamily hydrolase